MKLSVFFCFNKDDPTNSIFMNNMNKFLLIFSATILGFSPSLVKAQNYNLDSLPKKKYQSYPQEIPEKKWVSLFFKASRKYGRDQAQDWNNKYYSSAINLNNNGDVLAWIKNENDNEQHILIRTSIRNCQANSTSYSGLFVEYWQGSSLQSREAYYPSYYYGHVPSLAVEAICETAIAQHNQRI